jgi:hypothetical protein
MPLDFHSTSSAASGNEDIALGTDRSGQIVTVIATSVAVLIVALIAILMGMT